MGLYWTPVQRDRAWTATACAQNVSFGESAPEVFTVESSSWSFEAKDTCLIVLLIGIYIGRTSVLSKSCRLCVVCVILDWRMRDMAEVRPPCDLFDEKLSEILESNGLKVGRQALMTAHDSSIMVQIFESTNVPDIASQSAFAPSRKHTVNSWSTYMLRRSSPPPVAS